MYGGIPRAQPINLPSELLIVTHCFLKENISGSVS